MAKKDIGQLCQDAISALRTDWTERVFDRLLLRGFAPGIARTAAVELWRTADIDKAPEAVADAFQND